MPAEEMRSECGSGQNWYFWTTQSAQLPSRVLMGVSINRIFVYVDICTGCNDTSPAEQTPPMFSLFSKPLLFLIGDQQAV